MAEGNRYRQLLRNLAQLRTLGQPPAPPTAPPEPEGQVQAPGGRDVYLPPESGQLDSRLPVAHLPPEQQQMALQDMGGGAGPPQGASSPALVEAMRLLGGAQGSVGDLLKNPAMHDHLHTVLAAVKQDPNSLQSLAKIGIGSDKIQQFEQMLTQSRASGAPAAAPAAPSWLSGTR